MSEGNEAKSLRFIELGLVLSTAFAIPLVSQYVGSRDPTPEELASSVYLMIIHMMTGIFVLWYVLHRQGRSFHAIGLGARWLDLLIALLLAGLSLLAHLAAYVCIYYGSYLLTGVALGPTEPNLTYLQAGLTIGTALFFLFVPFFEEIIVRAYAMTELEALSGRPVVAVAGSVLLQSAYHLYQGLPTATAHVAGFLVFALYYHRSRRILPVILAHLLVNVFILVVNL